MSGLNAQGGLNYPNGTNRNGIGNPEIDNLDPEIIKCSILG